MAVTFNSDEAPVAHSMILLAKQSTNRELHPFQEFMCYWTAFNNIYTSIADRFGRPPKLKRSYDGTVATKVKAGVRIPQVNAPLETEQINMALRQFSQSLIGKLVEHESTRYFVYRTPQWRGVRIESDASGQKLNGVINAGRTVDQNYPVWSPIETRLYERYFTENLGPHDRHELADQILHVIYTVRNNLFHGGKRTDDANDLDVVNRALPLLRMIVEDFLEETLALSR